MINLPNSLSFLRIILTPLFIYLAWDGYTKSAMACLVIAGATDWFDGYFARLMGQESDFGAMIDPIADKFLLISAYIGFFLLDLVPLWLMTLVVGRDCLIITASLWAIRCRPHFKSRPLMVSKINTGFQILHILLLLSAAIYPLPPLVLTLSLWLTVFTTLLSGAAYGKIFIPLMRQKSHY